VTTVPCPHGMPTPAACYECMEDGNLEPPSPPSGPQVITDPFRARFDGHCASCNTGIHVGQRIIGFEDGTYQHARCARSET
jgi:hypothetical protein